MQITDMETWLLDNSERVYRFWVYRRMFTPYEIQQAYLDESWFEDASCHFGRIVEAIQLDGDWLLGILAVDETAEEILPSMIEYYRLSELRLCCAERDQPGYTDDDEEEIEA